jgi:hypothetical protein
MEMTALFGVNIGTPSGSLRGSRVMGIFSWLSSCGSGNDEPPSLVRTNDYWDSDMNEVRQAALEDVALIKQDDKLYSGQAPDEPKDQPQGEEPGGGGDDG